MIQIPKNDYIEDTSVNETTVQEICNVLLSGDVWHPYSENAYRVSNNELMSWGKGSPFVCFGDSYYHRSGTEHEFKRFNEAEMRRAWKEIIAAGYHIFEIWEYGSWHGYKCVKTPYYNGGREVADFSERWT